MKLAFIGSHGVGKTTLCYDLAGALKKHVPSVDIVKEVARSCPLPINRETSLPAQSWILHTQIATEIAAQYQNHTVICDRSALDNYAYLVAATGRHPQIEELVTYWMTTYDHLFHVPITFELEGDGVRSIEARFQQDIDLLVRSLLEEKQIPCHRLPSRGRPRWMRHILRVLDIGPAPARAASSDNAAAVEQIPLPMAPLPGSAGE